MFIGLLLATNEFTLHSQTLIVICSQLREFFRANSSGLWSHHDDLQYWDWLLKSCRLPRLYSCSWVLFGVQDPSAAKLLHGRVGRMATETNRSSDKGKPCHRLFRRQNCGQGSTPKDKTVKGINLCTKRTQLHVFHCLRIYERYQTTVKFIIV